MDNIKEKEIIKSKNALIKLMKKFIEKNKIEYNKIKPKIINKNINKTNKLTATELTTLFNEYDASAVAYSNLISKDYDVSHVNYVNFLTSNINRVKTFVFSPITNDPTTTYELLVDIIMPNVGSNINYTFNILVTTKIDIQSILDMSENTLYSFYIDMSANNTIISGSSKALSLTFPPWYNTPSSTIETEDYKQTFSFNIDVLSSNILSPPSTHNLGIKIYGRRNIGTPIDILEIPKVTIIEQGISAFI